MIGSILSLLLQTVLPIIGNVIVASWLAKIQLWWATKVDQQLKVDVNAQYLILANQFNQLNPGEPPAPPPAPPKT